MKPNLLVLCPLSHHARTVVEAAYTVHERAKFNSPAEFDAIAPTVQAILMGGDGKVPADLMAQLPQLKMIAVIGVGYDGVDTQAANARGIKVSHTPNVLNDDVADLALALMLNISRKLVQADAYVRAGQWAAKGGFPLANKMSGARVGIVGMGRIGKAIAKRCEAFDMQIAYTARSAKADLAYAYHTSTEALAQASDFLVLITPGGAQTRHMVNEKVLQALGANGYLINVARGSCVDQTALLQALQNNTIAGAALDVFDNEPNVPPEFFSLPNVVLAPHVGSATHATRKAMADLALNNLAAHFAGQSLLSAVPECQA